MCCLSEYSIIDGLETLLTRSYTISNCLVCVAETWLILFCPDYINFYCSNVSHFQAISRLSGFFILFFNVCTRIIGVSLLVFFLLFCFLGFFYLVSFLFGFFWVFYLLCCTFYTTPMKNFYECQYP